MVQQRMWCGPRGCALPPPARLEEAARVQAKEEARYRAAHSGDTPGEKPPRPSPMPAELAAPQRCLYGYPCRASAAEGDLEMNDEGRVEMLGARWKTFVDREHRLAEQARKAKLRPAKPKPEPMKPSEEVEVETEAVVEARPTWRERLEITSEAPAHRAPKPDLERIDALGWRRSAVELAAAAARTQRRRSAAGSALGSEFPELYAARSTVIADGASPAQLRRHSRPVS